MTTPPEPTREEIPDNDPRKKGLYERVRKTLQAIPIYFESGTRIEGLEAGDLFNLNSVLGSSIEIQVVDTLNRMRKVWDPDDEWPTYRFERSAQTFPDVRLVAPSKDGEEEIALGIELKGWYLLAKEGEPSFRYKVTPAACSEFDLLVVVPWHLKNVLSGVPVVHRPYIEQARYVAKYRNYWWQHKRKSDGSPEIKTPSEPVSPYPSPKTRINDEAVSDSGGNFGRIARIGIMDEYVEEMLSTRVAGIEARYWVSFFRIYAEAADAKDMAGRLAKILRTQPEVYTDDDAARLWQLLKEMRDLLG